MKGKLKDRESSEHVGVGRTSDSVSVPFQELTKFAQKLISETKTIDQKINESNITE